MAPWAKAYTVDMKDIYTELTLDKIENQPTGPEGKRVEDYKELFEDDNVKVTRRTPAKKVLIKADPGMGKSTFSKKVFYDWAVGIFASFTVMFFVSMKLVRPGDSIENIIIQQTPALEGLNVTEKKLKSILETFGSKCLIICDGLDEHAIGNNENFLKLIRGQNLLKCNLMATSRPHATQDIEAYFPVVVKLQGLTETNSREYILKVLKDKQKVEPVMVFNSVNFSLGDSSFGCPMLLLFICILVNADEIDLSRKAVTLGELYTRLVRCIYRKFTVSKGIAFHHDEFVEVLRRVGKFAMKSLHPGQGWFQRNEILRDVGEEAFEYGFLIGHEDFRLLGHPTSDIFITFAHRTIEEYLGSFYFVQILDYGASMGSLLGLHQEKPIFMMVPLFLHFCVWYLSKQCTKEYFPLQNRDPTDKAIKSFIKNRLNCMELHVSFLVMFFPALCISAAYRLKDDLVLTLFHEIISMCKKVRHLILSGSDPIGWVMEAVRPLLPRLLSIRLMTDAIPKDWFSSSISLEDMLSPKDLNIIADAETMGGLKQILSNCEAIDKLPSVFVIKSNLDRHFDLSQCLAANIKKLHVDDLFLSQGLKSSLSVVPIFKCPFLTHLALCRVQIDQSVASKLCQATGTMKMPSLSHLNLTASHLKGNLTQLFPHSWPKLTYLNLNNCVLDPSDIQVLGNRKLFPSLTSLVLFLGDESDDWGDTLMPAESILTNSYIKWERNNDSDWNSLFQSAWPNIMELGLYSVNKEEYRVIVNALNEGQMPKLKQLSLSMWEHAHVHQNVQILTERFSKQGKQFVRLINTPEIDYLPPVNVPTLTQLTLQGFIRTMLHLYMVTQSSVLTKLHKLDISHSSGITGTLSILLCHSFTSLNSLILSDCGLNAQDLYSLAQAGTKGRLPKLRHLDISENEGFAGRLVNFFVHGARWEQLEFFNVRHERGSISKRDFQSIVAKVQTGCLNSLQELRISAVNADFLLRTTLQPWQKLRTLHICTHNEHEKEVAAGIAAAVIERGLFPALTSFRLILTASLDVARVESLMATFRQAVDGVIPPDLFEPIFQYVYTNVLPEVNSKMPQVINQDWTIRSDEKKVDVRSLTEIFDKVLDVSPLVEFINGSLLSPMSQSETAIVTTALRQYVIGVVYPFGTHAAEGLVGVPSYKDSREKLLRFGVDVPSLYASQ